MDINVSAEIVTKLPAGIVKKISHKIVASTRGNCFKLFRKITRRTSDFGQLRSSKKLTF